MKAVMLAAGVGRRLELDTPKCLLEFDGKTLLQRHLEILRDCGIDNLTIGVGHQAADIAQALAELDGGHAVRLIENPDYRQGSIVTLWRLRECFAGDNVLLMDADVLYDHRMIERLMSSPHPNCFLLDRDMEPGDEPVKLCVRDGRLVEFRKQVDVVCDYLGESVGFFRLSNPVTQKLLAVTARYVEAGALDTPFEEALRDVLLAKPDQFGFEDITGLPWLEIDFPEDIERARSEIVPRLVAHR
ncbi:MAG: phosphocholine cytidylyltransferase family protein [Gammaproteobacteria bacterium]|nr:phosphocholine cytidylyltransferase family protein [Gammaproteobacteria bacterium]